MEGWHDCDEPKSKSKKKWSVVDRERKRYPSGLNGDVPKEAEERKFHVLAETQSGLEWNSIRDSEYEETHTRGHELMRIVASNGYTFNWCL